DRLGAGLGQQRAEDLQRARHRLARDQHLGDEEVTALEPGADLLQRRDQRLVQQRLRAEAHVEAGPGQLEHRRAVADQGVVVELLESLLLRPAAPSFCGWRRSRSGWCPSTTDSALASATHRAATSAMRAGLSRVLGPDTDSAATTAAPSRNTGAATAARPGSS